MIQMANAIGVRTLYSQVRRGFRRPGFFDVHYHSPWKLQREFQTRIGPTAMSVDGYFGLGIQPANSDLMPPFERAVIFASETFRRLSKAIPPLRFVADSLDFPAFRLKRCERMQRAKINYFNPRTLELYHYLMAFPLRNSRRGSGRSVLRPHAARATAVAAAADKENAGNRARAGRSRRENPDEFHAALRPEKRPAAAQ